MTPVAPAKPSPPPQATRPRIKPPNILIHWRAGQTELAIEDRGGFQSRNFATIQLLRLAAPIAMPRMVHAFSAAIFTDDFPTPQQPDAPCLAYCRSAEQCNVHLIPDFLFWGWPEVGIADYQDTAQQMIAAGRFEPMDDRLLWTGNPATHPTRMRFMEIAAADPRILATAVSWKPPEAAGKAESAASWASQGGYLSLPEHCRFAYLIDLQGRGYSARLKLLLLSGRPLFVQQRRWSEFFFADLVPNEHFIPVREDLADLRSQLDWRQGHQEDCARMAEAARMFARSRLSRQAAVQTLANTLVQCSATKMTLDGVGAA